MNINENIKKVRKYFKLSRNSFGEKLGVSQDVIANIELNRLAKPEAKEPLIKLIAVTFNVNEEWLRTGNGRMFNENQLFSLDEFLKKQNATELEIEIVKLIFSFDRETRGNLISKLKAVFQSEIITKEITATKEEQAKRKDIDIDFENIDSASLVELMSKTNKELQKRELQALKESSNYKDMA